MPLYVSVGEWFVFDPRNCRYGVAVHDFGKSWTSGLAFLAVIKSIDPSLVDMRRALLRTPRENLEEAFRTAHYTLGIPRLLEPEGRGACYCFSSVAKNAIEGIGTIRLPLIENMYHFLMCKYLFISPLNGKWSSFI